MSMFFESTNSLTNLLSTQYRSALSFIIRLKVSISKRFCLNSHSAVVKADLVLDDTEVEQKPGTQKPVENVWEGNLPLG